MTPQTRTSAVQNWLLPLLWLVLAAGTMAFIISEPTATTFGAAVFAWFGGVVTTLIALPMLKK